MNIGERKAGTRVYGKQPHELRDGEYMLDESGYAEWRGHWWVFPPDAFLGQLATHVLTVHEDGTLTAFPSILIERGAGESWHGYLEHGVWRRV